MNKVVFGQGMVLASDRHGTELLVSRQSAVLVTHWQVGGAKQPGGEEQQGWDVLRGRGRGLVVSADTLIVSDLEGDLMGSGGL